MSTKKASAKKTAPAAKAKAKDLKSKKDPKGGPLGGFNMNHNATLVGDAAC